MMDAVSAPSTNTAAAYANNGGNANLNSGEMMDETPLVGLLSQGSNSGEPQSGVLPTSLDSLSLSA